jgi:hypothetical protein
MRVFLNLRVVGVSAAKAMRPVVLINCNSQVLNLSDTSTTIGLFVTQRVGGEVCGRAFLLREWWGGGEAGQAGEMSGWLMPAGLFVSDKATVVLSSDPECWVTVFVGAGMGKRGGLFGCFAR